MSAPPPLVIGRLAPHAAFAAFGVFWGTWGAALPALRAQAGLTAGQLGTALLFVGLGALPAMLLTGRLVDRLGLRVTAICLALLSAAGVVVALAARDLASVTAGMLLVGATSGAADVAINTLAGEAEQRTGRPVLTRAHGVFSLAVVVSSLGVGASATAGLALVAIFSVAAVVGLALSAVVVTGTSVRPARPTSGLTEASSPSPAPATRATLRMVPLLVLGMVGALAYATENAHQSWARPPPWPRRPSPARRRWRA